MSALAGSRAVLVLGMHRSGTSALGGILSHAGVHMGKRLFGPQQGVNEKGFFENSNVVAINESLLDELGVQWDHPHLLELQNQIGSDPAIAGLIESFLEREYAGYKLWGLKDPRCSVMEPAWSASITAAGADLKRVLICRDPFEVADSLARRDNFPPDKSLMLWLSYNLSSLNIDITPAPIVITFKGLIQDSESTLRYLAERLEIPALSDIDHNAVLEKGMYRSQSVGEGQPELRALAQDLYQTVEQDILDSGRVESIRSRYVSYLAQLNPGLLSHIAKLSRSEIHYRLLFDEARDSWWWRLATPARWLERKLTRRPPPPLPPRR